MRRGRAKQAAVDELGAGAERGHDEQGERDERDVARPAGARRVQLGDAHGADGWASSAAAIR